MDHNSMEIVPYSSLTHSRTHISSCYPLRFRSNVYAVVKVHAIVEKIAGVNGP